MYSRLSGIGKHLRTTYFEHDNFIKANAIYNFTETDSYRKLSVSKTFIKIIGS